MHSAPVASPEPSDIRSRLVAVALDWEANFGVGPSITSAISEYDAAMLVGMTTAEYSTAMIGRSAVGKGHDFVHNGIRYQVKGNRPSGRKGSFVTLVPKATNYLWDQMIWILYNPLYEIQEAWAWDVDSYRDTFDAIVRLSPSHYRRGTRLGP